MPVTVMTPANPQLWPKAANCDHLRAWLDPAGLPGQMMRYVRYCDYIWQDFYHPPFLFRNRDQLFVLKTRQAYDVHPQ
ncbi:hypothetical protein TH19_00725 [Thalassospira profundimaris]|uniref:Uncharacterized protein n=1 Tax=Thalassospira profundimaris TaxID=502049 RepID=A0A367WGK5_9PROT|nr:hypothetical protein TH19_00725 [Thalassospira profundimaris]